jgi:hypothetical protein
MRGVSRGGDGRGFDSARRATGGPLRDGEMAFAVWTVLVDVDHADVVALAVHRRGAV